MTKEETTKEMADRMLGRQTIRDRAEEYARKRWGTTNSQIISSKISRIPGWINRHCGMSSYRVIVVEGKKSEYCPTHPMRKWKYVIYVCKCPDCSWVIGRSWC